MGVKDKMSETPCSSWVFLSYNIVVNVIWTLACILLNLPWIIQFSVKDLAKGNFTPYEAAENILFNNPYFSFLIVPAMIMGIIVPCFRYNKYLRAYHIVEILSAWIQFTIGLLTIMKVIRYCLISEMFDEQGNPPEPGNTIKMPKVLPMLYVSLFNGVLMIIQSFCMLISALIANSLCRQKIADKYDKIRQGLELAKDAKLTSVILHAIDIIITIGVIVYISVRFYLYMTYVEPIHHGEYELAMFITCLGIAVFSISLSIAALIAFIVTLATNSKLLVVPIIFMIFQFIMFVIQVIFFGIVCALVVTYSYFVITADTRVTNPSYINFYESLYGIGCIAIFRLALVGSTFIALLSTRKHKKSHTGMLDDEHDDVRRVRRMLR